MDFSNVVQEDSPEADGELVALTGSNDGSSPKALPTIWSEVSVLLCIMFPLSNYFTSINCFTIWQVMRFLTNPHKPMILALSRPDPKKNITTLLKAFGECRPLRELANLVSKFVQLHVYWRYILKHSL